MCGKPAPIAPATASRVLPGRSQETGRTRDRVIEAYGLGVAKGSGQLGITAFEVERLGASPQPPYDSARLGEATGRIGGIVEGQAVCLVLAPGHRVAWP
jgi:hypothetical protein